MSHRTYENVLWHFHIDTMAHKYSHYISMHGSEACEHVFGIVRQICTDFDFAELLQMVSKIPHYFKSTKTDNISIEREKSMHGSEACEHVFGIVRQICTDFDFAELLQMVSKIPHYFKSTKTDNISIEREKSVRDGYIFDYNKGNLTKDIISNLTK
ncbi:hypothetical protein Glove_272g34 [Diversispora epigaea]|uniref:Uncharacterized protein n=1 Tax=Diversispora epigaea TaxID=1348612 RepID=A0A397I3W7_9GLOM|nr:hypothetical protein Glove_272g34 [Diversispora epigaea]